jgi:hypothetical protein
LWVGAVTADDQLLLAGHQLARALAAHPPDGSGSGDRARDYGWPLGELEACLELIDDPVLATAAERLAAAIGARFDPAQRTFRFGEGERDGGVYFERAWLLGGVVLPALQAHLRRRSDPELQRRVAIVTQGLVDRLGGGALGVPTHWRWHDGSTFAVHYGFADPKALLLLEGLPPADLRRVVRRDRLWAALRVTPAADDPDLATSLTMVARCRWVYR